MERQARVVQNPVRYVDELERVQRQRRQQQQQQQNSEVEVVWGRNLNFYLIKTLTLEGPSFLAPNPAADYLDLDNQPGTSASSSRVAQQQFEDSLSAEDFFNLPSTSATTTTPPHNILYPTRDGWASYTFLELNGLGPLFIEPQHIEATEDGLCLLCCDRPATIYGQCGHMFYCKLCAFKICQGIEVCRCEERKCKCKTILKCLYCQKFTPFSVLSNKNGGGF
uniref:Uncharacterized protein n=1 Tax=Meloidogyne enterolobii TaxID=390850 RepID=A0A6V7VD47_MELEN|nr:unnamed protein product [Meloidogyne enterolobii]